MKKITLSQAKTTLSAYFMLFLISVTLLPFNLFHHHHSANKVHCVNISGLTGARSVQEGEAILKIQPEDTYKECLFCTWQMGAKLSYVVPRAEVFLPDYKQIILPELCFENVGVQSVENIPNKGPPAFLFS